MPHFRSSLLVACALAAVVGTASAASAESLAAALAAAYAGNPTLNAARAELRGIDENVPQALSGFRPTVSASATTGDSWVTAHSGGTKYGYNLDPNSVSLQVVQPIFRGFRTVNGVKAAETAVLAGRESLRNTEQTVLLSAATAYMNVVQAQANVGLTKQNVDFLAEQTRAARDRLEVGEGTRTDVAQTEARQAAGVSAYNSAVAALNAANAVYAQVIGHAPKNLTTAPAVNSLPKSVSTSVDLALNRHPSVLAAQYNVDIAGYNVSILEGALLPTAAVTGTVAHSYEQNSLGVGADSASVVGSLSVPIYQAGTVSSQIRQAKEVLGQRRIQVDIAREGVRAQAISAYGQVVAARAQVEAAQSQVRAAQLALEGIIEERKVGQQTTLAVLDAQSELLDARVALVQSQRDRVVASYTLLSAIGGLTAEGLGLSVAAYQPGAHYDAVRDKWFGLRTPDER